MMSSKDGVGQIIKACVTVVALIALTGGFRVIKATLDDMFRLTRGALDAIGPAQLADRLITLHIINEMLDVNLHGWTPVRDRGMRCRQYTLSSHSTTPESKKSELLMKMGFSGAILLRYSFIFVLVSLSLGICVVATADGTRFVPQLALDRFNPSQVVYHPRDPLLLVTDGVNNRIDILNVSDPAQPFKTAEILTAVVDATFSPQGDRIVSGGRDGTVRLWKLDGTLAAEPFKGHTDGVWSVAFSPQGGRIVSGGQDGTVRLWKLD